MRVIDWLFDHPGLLIGGVIVLVVGCIVLQGKQDDQKCAEVMALARTSHDSLQAKIACEQIRSASNTAMAISVGAGVIAGSAASR